MLAARALGWLSLTHLLVHLLSFGRARQMLARLSGAGRHREIAPGEYAQALARAAGIVPQATCLTRAVAAACLLRRDRQDARISIGVARDGRNTFRAHAWAESNGIVVTGGGPDSYAVLLMDNLEAARSRRS